MVKSRADVEAKMKDRVSSAGTYLQKGMASAEDPVAKLLKDPEGYAQKMKAGLEDSIKRGSYKVGLQRAADRNAWKGSQARAGAHFEERAGDMVKNAMETYETRAAVIDSAKKSVENMPTATRDQRIAKAAAYAKAAGQGFDSAFGRK